MKEQVSQQKETIWIRMREMVESYHKVWEILAVVILLLYPLRHITIGLDLWDTGYNYANFQYMGLEHMDPMWLFSTYLATALGHLLTLLPGAETLAGMNFYTGLLVSVLAVMGYFFCTRCLKWHGFLVFVGEMTAISLCWCPTALLYNYLTYVLFLACVILLYVGLSRERRGCLFAAGVCLGCNVLVRFSNLPQAALILAVWAYVFLQWMEHKRGKPFGAEENRSGAEEKRRDAAVEGASSSETAKAAKKGFVRRAVTLTLVCLGGYLCALAVLFAYIHLRYGMSNYVEGIQRLFAMTENAADYKATSMVMGMVMTYVGNLYWVARIGCIVAAGMVPGCAVSWCVKRAGHLKQWEKAAMLLTVVCSGWMYDRIFYFLRTWQPYGSVFRVIMLLLMVGILVAMAVFLGAGEKRSSALEHLMRLYGIWLAVTMVVWLYVREFSTFLEYWNYGAILRPGVLFLLLAMGIAGVRILQKSCPRDEKLISGLVILVILLTSLGSNNEVYPSLNNLFVAAPYVLVESWRFLCFGREKRMSGATAADRFVSFCARRQVLFPAKAVLVAFLGVFFFQVAGFGGEFVFAEATGVRDVSATVENNEILSGIHMSTEKAQWLTEISAYVEDQQLQGRAVILYGQIPALSYYLQLPSAFNPWSDLASYHLDVMSENLQTIENEITVSPSSRPLVLLEIRYGKYLTGGVKALEELGLTREQSARIEEDEKWQILTEFLQNNAYQVVFENEKFMLLQ